MAQVRGDAVLGAEAAGEAVAPVVGGRSLRAAAIRATAWTLGGGSAGHVLRLASNLILTRLLFPQAFGLMALVNVVLHGSEMLSDLGIGQSIVQNRRGYTRAFLNTAWTIQVIRGLCLFAAICLLALPVAWLYSRNDPAAWQLTQLLPVTGAVLILAGFNSTNLFTLDRRLDLGRLVTLNLGTQLFGVVVMIVWALIHPTVWALVGGALAGASLKLILSHTTIPGSRNRFTWDRECARELFGFGKWIFLGTVVAFFAARGDRLILGSFLTMEQFGVYAIAITLALVVRKLIGQHAHRVVFPLYSRLAERQDPDAFRKSMVRVRLSVMAAAIPPLCALVIFGQQVVDFLYDQRYHDAGWMLQILAAGMIGMAISLTSTPALLAHGDSFRNFVVAAGQLTSLLVGMAVGGWIFGLPGLVGGIAAASFLNYPVMAMMVRRHGVWMPWLDAGAVAVSAVMVGLGLALV